MTVTEILFFIFSPCSFIAIFAGRVDMSFMELVFAVFSLFLPALLALLAVVALGMPDREENDDDN